MKIGEVGRGKAGVEKKLEVEAEEVEKGEIPTRGGGDNNEEDRGDGARDVEEKKKILSRHSRILLIFDG